MPRRNYNARKGRHRTQAPGEQGQLQQLAAELHHRFKTTADQSAAANENPKEIRP